MYWIAALILAFLTTESSLTMERFLSNWCRWDANHYLNIAKNGYRGAVEVCDTCRSALLAKGISEEVMQNGQHLFLVFFPLFPWLMSLFGSLFGDIRLAGMFLSTLSYAGGCVYLYRLVRLDHSEQVARNSVVLLSLFPFGFFFGGIMTEGLFFWISTGMLYYIRQHKWWRAIVFGCFATMCRLQGILLIVPALIELLSVYRPWETLRQKNFQEAGKMILIGMSLLMMFAGTGIYLLINWVVDGYPFSFMIYQNSHWNNGSCLPTQTLSYVFKNAFGSGYDIQMRVALWIPQAVLAIVSLILLLYGIKKIRALYIWYGAVYVLLTYSVKWLISGGRYLSCCVPLFIVLAVMSEKRKWIMPVLSLMFAMLYMVYHVGYLKGMHVM